MGMKELKALLESYDRLKSRGIASVLATVVHVEGSSYRRAGARMLVDELGNLTGAISGGCLEGDSLRKALLAHEQGNNKLVTYDTSDEDDALIGAQLGCNGIIQVLFEPLDYTDAHNALELLRSPLEEERPAVVLVGYCPDSGSASPGTVRLSLGEENYRGRLLPPSQARLLNTEAARVWREKQSRLVELETEGASSVRYFLQFIESPVDLILVGAGNDAVVLSAQAELLGWKVTVIDGRSTHAKQERFGSSCQVIVSKPEDSLKQLRLHSRTCVVLMSHNYNYDKDVLRLMLATPEAPYIGMLGPRKKFERMKDELGSEGIAITPEVAERIFAPVGLDIGAETPEQIALSVLAEIQAVLHGKRGGFLRERQTPIHDREASGLRKLRSESHE